MAFVMEREVDVALDHVTGTVSTSDKEQRQAEGRLAATERRKSISRARYHTTVEIYI